MALTICGPKLSGCCMILSLWGIIQLGLMGVFLYFHSVAFAEDIAADIPTNENWSDQQVIDKFYKDVDDAYEMCAVNCWIAAAIYVGFFAFSLQQFWANQRKK
ncbi:hypothetical protein Zmor_023234 [Zophobas morio]|uniref:Uncharacterized protein n=1 Tax=Zophobas morio TaxID=2755281 RepID=A0AA38M6U5_9CUCU|nr:hypothetical protein Zmor_023234 [Zophobas morio]